jgi:hypothetical protein
MVQMQDFDGLLCTHGFLQYSGYNELRQGSPVKLE